MKFSLGKEHLKEYYELGSLLLTSFVPEAELAILNDAVQSALTKRLGNKRETEMLFLTGRDLWRENEVLKCHVTHRRLAEIASQLFKFRPLRLGADQLLPAITRQSTEKYESFLDLPSLKAAFSLQNIIGGLLISLSDGNIFFISHDTPFDIGDFSHSQLLIVYTQPKAFYMMNRDDPMTSFLMPYGYTYGERLNDQFNPLLLQ